MHNWQKWGRQLPLQVPIDAASLHSYGDASGKGVAATVYAVVTQLIKVSQGLVAAKSWLGQQGMTIPCFELISAHMAVNLVKNI